MMSLAARNQTPFTHRNDAPFAFTARLSIVLAAGIVAAGCDLNDNTFHFEGKAPSASVPPSPYAYRYPPNPPRVSVQDLKAFIEGYTRQDRIVLLDVWAGWFRRCRNEQTELAELQSDLSEDAFQVVSCNLDPAEQWSSRTVPLLQGSGANYPCLVLRPDERPALRSWLGPDWRYDLPARFLIDRSGEIAARMLSSSAIETVRHEARRLVIRSGSVRLISSRDSADSISGKLINIRTGTWQSLPASASDSVRPDHVAREIARFVEDRAELSANPRIAVLPFGSVKDRRRPAAYGFAIARHSVDGLADRGFNDLIGPADTQQIVDNLGISPLAIDVDPTLIRGHLDVDFLLMGWMGDRFPDEGPDADSLVANRATED